MSVELLLSLVAAVGVIVTGYYALAKLVVSQFDRRLEERFAAWNTGLAKIEEQHRALERDFLVHLAQMPEKYQRREDHIRFETVITAKLDALFSKIEQLAERQQVRV